MAPTAAHDAANTGVRCTLKRGVIHLVTCALVHDFKDGVPIGLLVVVNEVFCVRDDPV